MTTEEVKQFLSSYRNHLVSIRRLQEEQEQIRAIATSCGGASSGGTPGSTSDKVGKLAGRLADLDSIILAEMDEAIAQRDKIRRVIGAVEDDRLRNLLSLKYISGYSFEYIAEELNKSRMTIWRWHKEALLHIAKKTAPFNRGRRLF